MCISERLKQVLDAKNMTVTEFSNVTGISYRSAMNYLNEGRDPNVDGLIKIYGALGISITWLLTGEGKMYRSLPNDELEAKEQALINHYRMMSNDMQTAFDVSFKVLSEMQR